MAALALAALSRSALVALLAVAIAHGLRPIVQHRTGTPSRWRTAIVWLLLLAPLLTPTLLTAYVYREWALAWIRQPQRVEWLYRVLLLVRFTPVAVLVLLLAPRPPISRAALHAWRLSCPHRARRTALTARLLTGSGMLIQGPARNAIIAFAAVFLLTFVEFELASLLDVRTWTIWVFEARAMRMELLDIARRSVWPVLTQLALLVPILWLLMRRAGRDGPGAGEPSVGKAGWLVCGLAGVYLLAAATLGSLYPAMLVTAGAVRGLATLWGQSGAVVQIGYGLGQAGCAAVAATMLALLVVRFSRGPIAAMLCAPGLLGPLVVAMLVLWLFQWPVLREGYDTPLPLAVAHTLWLLPVAVVLVVLLAPLAHWSPSAAAAAHAGRLLGRSRDPAVRRAGRHLWAAAWLRPMLTVMLVLFCFAYFELTATAMLAPAGAMPSAVAAYNNMHYGQNDVLSARVLLNFMAVAVIIAAAAFAVTRISRAPAR